MIYLGTPGRMVGLKCPATQQVSADDGYRFVTTLEGRRKAQVVPGQRRVWSIGTSAVTTAAEVATLQEFAQGAWGPGPFQFVSADAPVTNLLTPAEANCDPIGAEYREADLEYVLDSPPMWTPDGWLPRSAMKTSGFLRVATDVPVIPGEMVTGSAYVRGNGGFVRILFVDSTGSSVSQHDSSPAGNEVDRRTVTTSVPQDAAYAQLWMTASVAQVGAPSFTWSDEFLGRSGGQGCRKAVVHSVSRDVTMAVPGRTWSELSLTVTEVG